MGLGFAIDDLYATGWSALDTTGCDFDAEGRAFPGVERIEGEFEQSGYRLTLKHIQLFDCCRAEWSEISSGRAAGAVVGQTEAEAAVYALAQLRRSALPTA